MKKSIVFMIIGFFIILVGFCILFFPSFNNYIFNTQQLNTIEQYDDEVEKIKNETKDNTNNEHKNSKNNGYNSTSIVCDYNSLRKAVKDYNKGIYENHQIMLSDERDYQEPSLNLSNYGLSNNIYGYIQIPSLGVNMSILLGANDYNMSLGAAHMSYTSIPYGGKNTNSVIAGHCGYGGKNMFRYISTLKKGDDVNITTPFGKLKYEVSEIKIIDPKDAESLVIQDNKDMVTLLTCHPYPSNKYRCLVYCERK